MATLAPESVIVPGLVVVSVPAPQTELVPLATVRLLGRESVKPTPVRFTVEFGSVTVKVTLVELFSGMLVAPKDLEIVGGATTVMLAMPVLPVPPSFDVTCTLLFFTPAVVPCTVTDIVHDPPPESVPEARLTVPDVGDDAVPPQPLLVTEPLVTKPDGRASVNATPVRVRPVFGLVMVNVREVVPFNGIADAPNDLEIVGGNATVSVALAVLPVPAFADVTFPVVLFLTPPVVPVTFTATVHVPPPVIVPPPKVSVVSPEFGVNVPPQDVEAPGVDATCKPDGSASVNATPNN